MMKVSPIDRYLGRNGSVAALVYVIVVVSLCVTSTVLMWETMQRYMASNAALETLSRLQHRSRPSNLELTTEGWPPDRRF